MSILNNKIPYRHNHPYLISFLLRQLPNSRLHNLLEMRMNHVNAKSFSSQALVENKNHKWLIAENKIKMKLCPVFILSDRSLQKFEIHSFKYTIQ